MKRPTHDMSAELTAALATWAATPSRATWAAVLEASQSDPQLRVKGAELWLLVGERRQRPNGSPYSAAHRFIRTRQAWATAGYSIRLD